MSPVRLGKKLQPAKKAWKSFSNILQSKVQKLNIPKDIKATFKRLLATFHALHHPTTRTSYAASNNHVHRLNKKNISAIRIEDLFSEPASSMHVHANEARAQEETSRGNEVVGEKDSPGGNSGIDTIVDAWKIVAAEVQVDERAEEFISKFRENLRLQKERSWLEYFQEMLLRSA